MIDRLGILPDSDDEAISLEDAALGTVLELAAELRDDDVDGLSIGRS